MNKIISRTHSVWMFYPLKFRKEWRHFHVSEKEDISLKSNKMRQFKWNPWCLGCLFNIPRFFMMIIGFYLLLNSTNICLCEFQLQPLKFSNAKLYVQLSIRITVQSFICSFRLLCICLKLIHGWLHKW